MININYLSIYYGPNTYAPAPVIVAEIALPEVLIQKADDLCLHLKAQFPEWFINEKSSHSEGQERLLETASQWALAALNEVRGFLHYAGVVNRKGKTQLWLEFHDPSIARHALELALNTLINQKQAQQTQKALNKLWIQCRQRHPDYQAQILMQAARAHNIPFLPFLPEARLWQFGWGSKSRVFMESASNDDGHYGSKVSSSKPLSKSLFRALGVPYPPHVLIKDSSELKQAAEKIGWPCVTKPVSLGGGKGVTANINSHEGLQSGFNSARQFSQDAIMVEAFVPGDDYRLLVVNGQLIATIRREPSYIIGDGQQTITQLIHRLNIGRSSNIVKSRYLRPIAFDQILTEQLNQQQVTLDTILPKQKKVTLRSVANLSQGGLCTDFSSKLHPDIRQIAEMLAQSTGIKTLGLDYITTDISRSWTEVNGAFIELNTTPGLDAMIAAGADPIKVGQHILGDQPARIPINLTITENKQLPRYLEALQQQEWPSGAGWACAGKACIAETALQISDNEAWPAVKSLLRNKILQSLTIICSLKEIMQFGLPVDQIDSLDVQDVEIPKPWQTVLESALVLKTERCKSNNEGSSV